MTNRDMADAHETARERDAKAKADARHARFMAAIDRILARDPQTTGDSTPPSQETPMPISTITVHLGPEVVALLTEIRDRLPEREDAEECGCYTDDSACTKHDRPDTCCGKCPPIAGGGYDCTCVGNPRCEKADTPEEWHVEPAPADERRVNVTITDVYAVPSDYGFLRINVGPENAVIDQNASNVTVTDVEPAPADVDPDEALAIAMFVAQTLPRPGWDGMAQRGRDNFLAMARAAREHIEAERSEAEAKRDQWKADVRDAAIARAEKAEADLARVTEDRDRLWGERDKAQAKADRYDALREDLANDYHAKSALKRDDDRAES